MKKVLLFILIAVTLFASLSASSTVIARGNSAEGDVNVIIKPGSITWDPAGGYGSITLTIAGPGGYYFNKIYGGNANPSISSGGLGDGSYNYQLILSPGGSAGDPESSTRGTQPNDSSNNIFSGSFGVQNGAFVTPSTEPAPANAAEIATADVVHADDLIVQGSGCFGFDCVDNESFGFDTIRLKENNLRIGFSDTSVGAFPSNDWTIVANDTVSGGSSFLGFEDVTGAKFPFKVMAGAPTNSLFVSSNGDIGVRTSTPVLDFHASTTDTPGLRLEQTNGGGFTAQTWDVAGNEANFFVRDVTGGSRLPFRIRPGAPTSSIDIAASGNVGIGTDSPAVDLDIANTGAPAIMNIRRTDSGATLQFASGLVQGTIGTSTNFPLAFNTNNVTRMTISTAGVVTVNGPVNATAFNVTSDRNAKENFRQINSQTVLERLAGLPISTWNYIENDNKNTHMGPMAQDFYAAFGLGGSDKQISVVDANGVAFAAIQALNSKNTALAAENENLRSTVNNLEQRISALEAGASTPAESTQQPLVIMLVVMNLGLLAVLAFSNRQKLFNIAK